MRRSSRFTGSAGRVERPMQPAECIGAKEEAYLGQIPIQCTSERPTSSDSTFHAGAHTPLHPAQQRLSKEVENHMHMVALYTVFYNWTRVHKTLRVTPAMEARLTDRLWSMQDFAEIIEAAAPKLGWPATYRK